MTEGLVSASLGCTQTWEMASILVKVTLLEACLEFLSYLFVDKSL